MDAICDHYFSGNISADAEVKQRSQRYRCWHGGLLETVLYAMKLLVDKFGGKTAQRRGPFKNDFKRWKLNNYNHINRNRRTSGTPECVQAMGKQRFHKAGRMMITFIKFKQRTERLPFDGPYITLAGQHNMTPRHCCEVEF